MQSTVGQLLRRGASKVCSRFWISKNDLLYFMQTRHSCFIWEYVSLQILLLLPINLKNDLLDLPGLEQFVALFSFA
jgi:hypothetical protein